MSKSTAKGATKTESGSKSGSKSETKSAKAESTATPAEKSTKGQAAAAHSPSYFSSVSTPKYRAGWDSVFTSGSKKRKA